MKYFLLGAIVVLLFRCITLYKDKLEDAKSIKLLAEQNAMLYKAVIEAGAIGTRIVCTDIRPNIAGAMLQKLRRDVLAKLAKPELCPHAATSVNQLDQAAEANYCFIDYKPGGCHMTKILWEGTPTSVRIKCVLEAQHNGLCQWYTTLPQEQT